MEVKDIIKIKKNKKKMLIISLIVIVFIIILIKQILDIKIEKEEKLSIEKFIDKNCIKEKNVIENNIEQEKKNTDTYKDIKTIEDIPKNDLKIKSGTKVQKPEPKGWDTNKIDCYSDGLGNTIPVPKGFTPISDEEGQGSKFTGFVIRDISIDSKGNPTDTNGNEFVWIPVEGMNYTYNRYSLLKNKNVVIYNKQDLNNYSEELSKEEEISVKNYGGYYIGRYEAGVKGQGKCITIDNHRAPFDEWTGYQEEKLVIQKDKRAWNWITRDRAIIEANKLYNKENNNVISKLCSSYAWDTALKFIETNNPKYIVDSERGNYINIKVQYKNEIENEKIKEENKYELLQTGQTKPVNNIYDMGGNLWEWTTENCNVNEEPYTIRGGTYSLESSKSPASARSWCVRAIVNNYIGFRVAIYM